MNKMYEYYELLRNAGLSHEQSKAVLIKQARNVQEYDNLRTAGYSDEESKEIVKQG